MKGHQAWRMLAVVPGSLALGLAIALLLVLVAGCAATLRGPDGQVLELEIERRPSVSSSSTKPAE